MELMRNWIINIITVVMLSAFAEIIIPEGSFKKYSKLVIGLIVMIVILRPLVYITDSEALLHKITLETGNQIDKMKIIEQSHYMQEKQRQQIVRTYHDNLTEQVKQRVDSVCGPYETQVVISADTDLESSGFGSIRAIEIRLQPQEEGITTIKPVQTVHISKNLPAEEREAEENEKEKVLKRQIVDTLQAIYNVPEENIRVEIGDGGSE